MTSWKSWWRHQMETFSALLAICAGNSPVPGEFPAQRPGTQSFDVFFDLRLNKRFSKQSLGWWFEPLLCPLWRHCNVKALNHCPLGDAAVILNQIPRIYIVSVSCEIAIRRLPATIPDWWLVDAGWGNGLVPSGNKPLPEPKFYFAIHVYRYQATMS